MVGATLAGGGAVALLVTSMRKAGSCEIALPSEASIRMEPLIPTLASDGVPVSAPVVVLKVAQAGTFVARKVSGSPSGSAAVGVNEYDEPAESVTAGVPAMMGAEFWAPLAVDSPSPPQPASASAKAITICLPQIRMFGS